MSDPMDTAARSLARQRWDKPHNVERRIDALGEHVRRVVDTFPPLSDVQRDKLRAALDISINDSADEGSKPS